MNVSLTPELEEFVRERVNSGRYRSASEVVRAALRLLQDREKLREVKLEELRAAVQRGLDSGPVEEWDKDEFLKRARERWENEQEKEPKSKAEIR